ncbi:MAG TPA: 30S ribosomal protein S17e [Candidatus Nanoarchaeia archaeon]|nr:30S ribosomal protein S17e [Candidatus Nanoarchaeia archaeon]
MGRIRTTLIKRTAEKLIKRHPDKFSTDFSLNKPAVTEAADVPTKKLRNLIAGYITKLKKTTR